MKSELLEILTKGRFVATAHRVINPSEEKRRISVPVFINPALDASIVPLAGGATVAAYAPEEHIHRVVERGAPVIPFQFRTSEWARKGLGKWCYRRGCLHH